MRLLLSQLKGRLLGVRRVALPPIGADWCHPNGEAGVSPRRLRNARLPPWNPLAIREWTPLPLPKGLQTSGWGGPCRLDGLWRQTSPPLQNEEPKGSAIFSRRQSVPWGWRRDQDRHLPVSVDVELDWAEAPHAKSPSTGCRRERG